MTDTSSVTHERNDSPEGENIVLKAFECLLHTMFFGEERLRNA
jgi:hypothetical protein